LGLEGRTWFMARVGGPKLPTVELTTGLEKRVRGNGENGPSDSSPGPAPLLIPSAPTDQHTGDEHHGRLLDHGGWGSHRLVPGGRAALQGGAGSHPRRFFDRPPFERGEPSGERGAHRGVYR